MIKKIPAFIGFIAILLIGYLFLQIIPPLLYQNDNNITQTTDCPQYIIDFVAKNPQASELKDNYTTKQNNEPIELASPDGIPLYIQWDSRWAFNKYGDEIIGTAGCGPTCLAMVSVGLTGNIEYNPRYIANYAQNNNYLEGSKTSWSLMQEGCRDFGLKATPVTLNKAAMINELNQGHPIICSVRPGDFTDTGHFIVITKVKDNNFIVNDPNSRENSQRQWSYERLSWQIKAMWSYSLL
ncbi:C39 family peptidase [uncultured Thomasclavelia sp.]|uniref:C39 family peptidase n=1 Tax=uncultured Thomasclavelia sp. TaxID=3025759 RepID=UPI00260D7E75|nr:C39 family peptidase [uncultured Thomasclavelia sp.]